MKGTMAQVNMKTAIEASADTIWQIVRDYGGNGRYVAAISGIVVEGQGVGAIRTITLQDGAELVERLDIFDDDARTLTYSIVKSPLPLADYVATMTVRELAPSRCELQWSSTFEPDGAPEAEAKAIVEGIYGMGFEGLKKLHGG